MALCCCLATQHSASAEPRLLRLRLVGDQAVSGTLVPVDARGCVGIQSRCFEQPFVIPAANVLEASTEEFASVSTSSNDTNDRYAVDTVAGNRWVGRLLAGDENQCV